MAVLLKNMGYFGNNQCEIVIKSDEIYCRCLDKFPECDMSQWGWGMGAFCPLYNFNYNIQDSTWKKHLESVNMSYLIEKIKQIQQI